MSTAAAIRTDLTPALDQTPGKCGEIYLPDMGAISVIARDWAKKNDIKPAALDTFRVCVVMIDNQIDFCIGPDQLASVFGKIDQSCLTGAEKDLLRLRFGQADVPRGSLYVAGAEEDSARACSFIQRNADVITTLVATIDTHTTYQIFNESFLVAGHDFTYIIRALDGTQVGTRDYKEGDHPDPMTFVATSDVREGNWKLNPQVAYAVTGSGATYPGLQDHLLYYCEQLELAGKYMLCIWPYHTMLGTPGHSLVPAIAEVCHLHDIARGNQTKHEIKGGSPLTENYSPFAAEVLQMRAGTAIAQRNTQILEKILTHDAVLFLGQAKSHCYAWAVDDLLTDINQRDPTLVDKVYLVEDCTSPVVVPGIVDFTAIADEAFERFQAAGMHVVKSTTPTQDYLSIG